jgi:hypothetical protein
MIDEQTAFIPEEQAIDPIHELISSRRVEGTLVFNADEERLGTIHSVMIDKRSGKVAYAVLSVGGFLGIGAHVHPVPWDVLTYDVNLDGYVVNLTREQLREAPMMRLDEADRPRGRDYDEEVSGYYGKLPWWGL